MSLWRTLLLASTLALALENSASADAGDWPQWRGPNWDGMARGDAPLKWSDTENIKWKAETPGRGLSSPVIWGDRISVTTAVATSEANAAAAPSRGGRFGPSGPA